MENSIEKDEEILNNIKTYMQENIDKGWHKFVYNDLGYDEKCVDVINAIEHIVSDYKRVLKENEILKEEKEQAWEEWNNLEQGSYQTEQNLKKQLEKLRIENDKLRAIRHETKYGMETTYLIPKERLIEINTNKYIVEIENGKFVDLKEVYQENEELKEKENKIYKEVQESLAFEKFLIVKERKPDLFNQGRFYISQIIYDILNDVQNPEGIHKENKCIQYIDYIPVQIVKEKIEEIQKEYEETLKTANFKEIEKMNNINFRGITLEGQRSILRELLEKR